MSSHHLDPRRMIGQEMVLCVRSGRALQELDFMVTDCTMTVDAPRSLGLGKEHRYLREPPTTRLTIQGIVKEREVDIPIFPPRRARPSPRVEALSPLAAGPDFSERDGTGGKLWHQAPETTDQRDPIVERLLGRA